MTLLGPEPHLEPARSIRAREVPPILQRSIITIDEADKLFDMYIPCNFCKFLSLIRRFYRYFKYMNLSVSLIDPVLHTSKSTALRSPLLFTVGKSLSITASGCIFILVHVSLCCCITLLYRKAWAASAAHPICSARGWNSPPHRSKERRDGPGLLAPQLIPCSNTEMG